MKRVIFALTLVASITGCSNNADVAPKPKLFQADKLLKSDRQIGCSTMLDTFCDALFSPHARGNLRIGDSDLEFTVNRGSTENHFSKARFLYDQVKLKNRRLLPADFRSQLDRQGYFPLLRTFLARPPLHRMSFDERAENLRTQYRLNGIWRSSVESALLERMRKLYPGHHLTPPDIIPIEEKWEKSRQRRILSTEISVALWKNHPNWRRVEKGFREIRRRLLARIEKIKIPEEVKSRWARRLREVRLVVPGSLPEIVDNDCASTQANAYYYPRLNVLTVCAGDFNGVDIYQTLSHELAHAVDLDSMSLDFLLRSRLSKEITNLRQQSCRNQKLSCSKWAHFKTNLQGFASELHDFQIDLPRFQQCLQRHPPAQELTEDILQRAVDNEVIETAGMLSDSNAFLRLTKKRLPYPDGKWRPNHSYLNLCKAFPEDGPPNVFDTDKLILQFFVSEYRCSDGKNAERLGSAIATARELTRTILKERLRMKGSFSSNLTLVNEGYASPSDERFADVVGSYALADVLEQTQDIWHRRQQYFANSAWQCSRPSLSKVFPEEASIERLHSLDSHTIGRERRVENLSAPIRSALLCVKDFNFKECTLEDDQLAPPEGSSPASEDDESTS